MLATSAVLPAGWRIRLALAGADFPVVWPPGERVTLTFLPEQSRLILPGVPRRGEETTLDIPSSPPPPSPPDVRSEDGGDAEVIREGGSLTYRRHRFSFEHQPARADLTYSSEETWSITVDDEDPATTAVRSDGEVRMERPGWSVATRGHLALSADADNFHLSIGLTALHNDEIVFSRTWEDRVPREWA
jgi:hypothetical protein